MRGLAAINRGKTESKRNALKEENTDHNNAFISCDVNYYAWLAKLRYRLYSVTAVSAPFLPHMS